MYARMGYALTFGFDSSSKQIKKRLSKTQLNIFSTCLIMVVSFLFCWSFYIGTMMAAAIKNGDMRTLISNWFYIAELFLEVNSSINPVIYTVR